MTPPRSMSPTSTTGTSGGAREAHVGDVVGAQVDLRRAARALDEHEVGLARAAGRSCPARRPSGAASAPGTRAPWRCRRPCPAPRPARRSRSAASAAPGSCARWAARRAARACSACARPISPPSAVTAALFDMFCGLNGRTARPASREGAAQARDEQRLADIGARALDHQSAARAGIRTRCPAAPSRRPRSGASPASSR